MKKTFSIIAIALCTFAASGQANDEYNDFVDTTYRVEFRQVGYTQTLGFYAATLDSVTSRNRITTELIIIPSRDSVEVTILNRVVISITNILNELKYSAVLTDTTIIDVRDWNAGIYFFKCRLEGVEQFTRFLIYRK